MTTTKKHVATLFDVGNFRIADIELTGNEGDEMPRVLQWGTRIFVWQSISRRDNAYCETKPHVLVPKELVGIPLTAAVTSAEPQPAPVAVPPLPYEVSIALNALHDANSSLSASKALVHAQDVVRHALAEAQRVGATSRGDALDVLSDELGVDRADEAIAKAIEKLKDLKRPTLSANERELVYAAFVTWGALPDTVLDPTTPWTLDRIFAVVLGRVRRLRHLAHDYRTERDTLADEKAAREALLRQQTAELNDLLQLLDSYGALSLSGTAAPARERLVALIGHQAAEIVEMTSQRDEAQRFAGQSELVGVYMDRVLGESRTITAPDALALLLTDESVHAIELGPEYRTSEHATMLPPVRCGDFVRLRSHSCGDRLRAIVEVHFQSER